MTIVVTADTTRDELAEALCHLTHKAKRDMPRVGSETLPTAWDLSHKRIDAVLDDWEQADRTPRAK